MINPDVAVALDNCAREPIHIPGRIQGFGALVGFDMTSKRLRYYSDNITSMFEGVSDLSFDRNCEEWLANRDIVHAINGGLSLPSIGEQRDRIGAFEFRGKRTDFSLFVSGGCGVLELEPDPQTKLRPQSAVSIVRSMLAMIRSDNGVEPFLGSATRALRHLTGHDRVMAYRFLENGDGEVIAEACSPGVEPFLGLRYPASDIPLQVRQIMLRSPFRIIADIQAPPVALVADPACPPLDLTLSQLRGVSPMHIEYLANMGVRSTMNVSIVVNERLWGLFAFHHYRPRTLSPDQRSICELFGQLASLQLQQIREAEGIQHRRRVQAVVRKLEDSCLAPKQILGSAGEDLLELTEAQGVAWVEPREVVKLGETPADSLIRKTCSLAIGDILHVDSLVSTELGKSDDASDFGRTAGALAMRTGEDCWLVFFRNELVSEIRWAGKEEKKVEYGPNGPRLSPRGSFEEYKESVIGRANPWTNTQLAAATEICKQFGHMGTASESAKTQQLRRQKEHQDLLIAELNHRVRNTLALVRSIARQSRTPSQSLEQYVISFEQRIAALSQAHDMIGGSGLQWAKLEDLLRSELKPFQSGAFQVEVEGPAVAISGDLAPIVSLLFHELTSNAVKHGAFSPRGKSLSVKWYEDDGGYSLVWAERLRGTLVRPTEKGFGFALIQRAIPYESGGEAKIEFTPDGLRVWFWFPSKAVIQMAERMPPENVQVVAPSATCAEAVRANASGKSVLVVEDNVVLAMEMEKMLYDLGVDCVDAIPDSASALTSIARKHYDVAFLDINLGSENSFGVAKQLQSQGVPIILVSGYSNQLDLPESMRELTRLAKPISRLDIAKSLGRFDL